MSEPNIVDWSIHELYAPIQIVPGLVVCLDDVEPPDDGSAVIFLERGESFGTGAHPATRAVLMELFGFLGWVNETNAHLLEGKRLIDYNCGTGLLALVAKAAFPQMEVIAVADKHDHMVAVRNLELNGGTGEILVRSLKSFRGPRQVHKNKGTFDYIITHAADPAVGLMSILLKEDGTLIFGGHNAQVHHMHKNRITEFFNVVNVDDILGWPVIRAEKIPQ